LPRSGGRRAGENVEVVRRVVEAQQRGEPLTGALDPNIEWDISAYPLPDFPDRGKGRESFLNHLSHYLGGWNDYEATIRELLEAGSEVVSIMHERAKLRASDAVLERDLSTVWTITDGSPQSRQPGGIAMSANLDLVRSIYTDSPDSRTVP